MKNEKRYIFLDLDSVMITERKFDSVIQSTYIADPFDPLCIICSCLCGLAFLAIQKELAKLRCPK